MGMVDDRRHRVGRFFRRVRLYQEGRNAKIL